jgi:hypothetical protein
MLIILAVFLIGGGGTWILSQIVTYRRDRALELERARTEYNRKIETDLALRETLSMIAEKTANNHAKAA